MGFLSMHFHPTNTVNYKSQLMLFMLDVVILERVESVLLTFLSDNGYQSLKNTNPLLFDDIVVQKRY